MDALPHPDAPLPDDVPTLHALVRRLLAEVAELRGKLDAALKHRFGRRSERRPRRKEPKEDGGPAKKRDEHGRSPLPDHLPRREVVHDLTEAERPCPCCGTPRECIGEQTAEQLDLEPAKFFVLRTVRKTYACKRCGPDVPPEQRITTAGPAQVGPIPKGLCGPGLLAHAITAKFADHTPLHRLAGQLARSGVGIARSTLGGWMARAADLLLPLVALMHGRLLTSRVIHGDDTGVKLRVKGVGKAKKAHLWACIGDADFPYVVFDFTADYTAAGPGRFLKGFGGHLQADALAQYEGLYRDGVKHCCCWAHARRKFVAASEGGDRRADTALTLIRELYAVERTLPPLLPPSDEPGADERRRRREEERRAARQAGAGPVLKKLGAWLEQEAGALPKSPLGQAIGYARNNWAALGRYLEQGYLGIDNNLSERTLRAVALGRNNWGVLGGEAGGRTAAVLYSVVGTCKHLQIDPFAYLRDALPGLFALGDEPTAERMLDWLPDRWLLRRARESPAAAG